MPDRQYSRESRIQSWTEVLLGFGIQSPSFQRTAARGLLEEEQPAPRESSLALVAHMALTTDEYEVTCAALRAVCSSNPDVGAVLLFASTFMKVGYQGGKSLETLVEYEPALAKARAESALRLAEDADLMGSARDTLAELERSKPHMDPAGAERLTQLGMLAAAALYDEVPDTRKRRCEEVCAEDRLIGICVLAVSTNASSDIRGWALAKLAEMSPETARLIASAKVR